MSRPEQYYSSSTTPPPPPPPPPPPGRPSSRSRSTTASRNKPSPPKPRRGNSSSSTTRRQQQQQQQKDSHDHFNEESSYYSASVFESSSPDPFSPPTTKTHYREHSHSTSSSSSHSKTKTRHTNSSSGNITSPTSSSSSLPPYHPHAPTATNRASTTPTAGGSSSHRRPSSSSLSSSSPRKSHHHHHHHHHHQNKREDYSTSSSSPLPSKYTERAFQTPLDEMTVSIRSLELASRTAFERLPPPSPLELQEVASPSSSTTTPAQSVADGTESVLSEVSSTTTTTTTTTTNKKSSSNKWKISPSLQHASVLTKLYNQSSARQLSWSASVSPDADPFISWFSADSSSSSEDSSEETDQTKLSNNNNNNNPKARAKRRKHLFKKRQKCVRQGRYIPINPYTSSTSSLPSHAPPLTNKKRRLPSRSDVGFPRATEEEIVRKQGEIQREAELEESSPRVLLLIGAGDLGCFGVGQNGSGGGGGEGGGGGGGEGMQMNDELHPEMREEAKEWSGGCNGGGWNSSFSSRLQQKKEEVVGWGDIPLAGKELVTARYFDIQSSFSFSSLDKKTKKKKKQKKKKKRGVKPSQVSLFSPPIDASFSSTLGWRPRPFSDRPSGYTHFIACPMDVRFSVGDIEPLVCTMALYILGGSGGDVDDELSYRGKISEEFVFPAGDWRGMLREESANILAAHFAGRDYLTCIGNTSEEGEGTEVEEKVDNNNNGGGEGMKEYGLEDFDMDAQQKWRRRKRRGLFSFDPLALGGGGGGDEEEEKRQKLFLVVQVHKATHADAAAAYLSHDYDLPSSSSSHQKGGGGGIGKQTGKVKKGLSNRIKRLGKSMKKHGGSTPHEKLVDSGGGYNEGHYGSIPPPFSSSKTVHSTTARNANNTTTSSEYETTTGGGGGGVGDVTARAKSMMAFNAFGTQFLTPVSFGICPVFPPDTTTIHAAAAAQQTPYPNTAAAAKEEEDETMSWPNGAVHQMQFYAYPSMPESHDDFVDRLSKLADVGLDHVLGNNGVVENCNRVVAGKATIFTSVLGVDFTQAMLQTPNELSFPMTEEESLGKNNSGGAAVPMSSLPRLLVDVSGDCAIMMNPDNGNTNSNSITTTVGGGGASSSATGGGGGSFGSGGGAAKKRSNLVRLPAASDPSGYADSFEVKEVLYLPPRLDKKYDHDVPGCSRTMLNLLYLYPKLIKLDHDASGEGQQALLEDGIGGFSKDRFYSVRIRLVRQGINVDEETGAMEAAYHVLDSIYNPAPGGPPILKTMYTKIPHCMAEESSSSGKGAAAVAEAGIPLRDEVKVRLPDILDGGHFLQFSLVSIELKDGFWEAESCDAGSNGLVPEPLAETLIPLSSSSTRETTSGTKITTIIPNGLHRIKIGKFQLQVETRLASSVHVSDPGVAMVLRDFPYAKDDGEAGNDGLSTVVEDQLAILKSRSSVGLEGMANTNSSSIPNVPFHRVISNASEQSIVHHFHALVFMHMCNFVNRGAPEFDLESVSRFLLGSDNDRALDSPPSQSKEFRFMMENARSFFELVRKAKAKFLCDSIGVISGKRLLQKFLKDFLDSFDEASLSMRLREVRGTRGISGDYSTSSVDKEPSLMSRSVDSSTNRSQLQQFESLFERVNDAIEDKMLETAVRLAVQQEGQTHGSSSGRLGDQPLYGRSSSVRGDGLNNGPLTRRAYGATKTDQMRAEAEMHGHRMHFTFFDDDETVMTEDLRDSRHEKPPPMETVLEAVGDNGNGDLMNQWGIAEDDSNFDELTQASAFDSFQSSSQEFIGKNPSMGSNATSLSMSERARSMAKSFGRDNLANRVNTFAQVMIAPCMAPTLTTVLVTGTGNSPGKPKTSTLLGGPIIGGTVFTKDTTHSNTYSKAKIVVCQGGNEDDGKRSIISPGSDAEDEEDLGLHASSFNSDLWKYPGAPANGRLRSVFRDALNDQLAFSIPIVGSGGHSPGVDASESEQPFLYECIFVLWLQAWIGHAAVTKERMQEKSSKQNKRPLLLDLSSIVFQHYEPTQPHTAAGSFTAHLDIILPICLKSMVLRCSSGTSEKGKLPTTILDSRHMEILELIVQLMAGGLVCQALSGDSNRKSSDAALLVALSSNDSVLEFLIGLLAIIHPAQVSLLIRKYFDTLKNCEANNRAEAPDKNDDSQKGDLETAGAANDNSSETVWTHESLRRVRCARQLRLHAAEKLSTIPRFVALNYPCKFSSLGQRPGYKNPSWTNQNPGPKQTELNCTIETIRSIDNNERFPKSFWLAELLVNECLTICSNSCEAVVAEAVAQIKASSHKRPPRRNRRGSALSRDDLLRFQSTAIHAITCVYELLLRRHAMDTRFQSNDCRSRVAAMFVYPVLENSINAVQWLSRMESTHKVRSLWLLCFVHILQEAPEVLLREHMRSYCSPPKYRIHRIIRLLRLSTSTFQCFFVQNQDQDRSSTALRQFSPWLIQEIFNTICAATNMLVDECVPVMSSVPHEERIMAHGILDLLLHVVATPQSSVTHLRALGGASQALDKFGVALFLEAVGDSLEHWARMVLTLMNSISLSVRSMAVDFIVSLLGGAFEEGGNMDEIALVFLTVLPEVVAREIALFSVSGKISTMKDVECSLWPLRRALADVEETNPLDDDRVDPQLSPFLGTFCRTCQAVIDSVLIELRLKGNHCVIVGSRVQVSPEYKVGNTPESLCSVHTFDADEESVFEAANFFLPETAPSQRLRWLLTLKSLHESKGQWVEAAETLILCAKTIADAIPYIKTVWRPSRFILWHNSRRSLWLSTIGEEVGIPNRGNTQVMEFADSFLEPQNLLGTTQSGSSGKLDQPTVAIMCKMLTHVTKEAVLKYVDEDGMEALAYLRLEHLLKGVMGVIEDHSSVLDGNDRGDLSSHTHLVEENAALRKMAASLNGDLTRLAERLLLLAEEKEDEIGRGRGIGQESSRFGSNKSTDRQYYVKVLLLGKKPERFIESTTIPTFLEWETSSICRVPKESVARAFTALNDGAGNSLPIITSAKGKVEQYICAAFAEPLLDALSKELRIDSITLSTEPPTDEVLNIEGDTKTFLVVSLVHMEPEDVMNKRIDAIGSDTSKPIESKRFFVTKKGTPRSRSTSFVEFTVAQQFPCALSRQRTLITSEFFSES